MYLDPIALRIFCAASLAALAVAQVLRPESSPAMECIALLAFLTLSFFPSNLFPAMLGRGALMMTRQRAAV